MLYTQLLSQFQMSLEHLKRGNNSISSQEPTQNQVGSTSIPVRENDLVTVLVLNLPKLVTKLLRNGLELAKLTLALPVGWNKFMEKMACINFTSFNNEKLLVKGSASTSKKTLKTKPSKRLQQTKLPKKIAKSLKSPALSSAKWIELKH